jgi:hypothetical protein
MHKAPQPRRSLVGRILNALGRVFKKKKKPTGSIYPLR